MIRKSFVLVCFVISWLGAFSQITQVSGEISTNTVWQDTIHIVGDVRVLDGVTLSVNPGTHISFRDSCVVNIEGTFIAEGTADNKITFMNDSSGYFLFDNSPTGANGAMNDNDSSVIKYWDLPYLWDMQERFLLVKSFNNLSFSNFNVLDHIKINSSFIELNNSEMEITECSFDDVFLYNDTCGLIKATDSSKLVIRDNYFYRTTVNDFSNTFNSSTILLMSKSAAVIEDNSFIENRSESGSCLYLFDTDSVLINNNIFISNESHQGGAVYIDSCMYVSIDAGLFNNGHEFGSNYYGGAIYSKYSEICISNSIFTNNFSYRGSAVYITNSDFTLYNNLFYRNGNYPKINDTGGAVFIGALSQGLILNCTFSDNRRADYVSYSPRGGSGLIIASSGVDVQNTIFYNNINELTPANYQLYIIEPNAFPVIRNCVLDSISYGYNCLPNGTIENLYDINPQFLNSEQGEYSLTISSPCVDAGLFDDLAEDILPDTDLAGDNRLFGSSIDIGAYEYNNSRPVFEVNDTTMLEDSTLLLQLCINDADIGDAHFVCITTDTTVLNVTGIVPSECGFAYTLVPKPNYFGETEVQIMVTDSTETSNASLSKSYNLEIVSVNDAPEIISVYDTLYYYSEGRFHCFQIIVSIEDVDNNAGHIYSYYADNENMYYPYSPSVNSCFLGDSYGSGVHPDVFSANVGIKVTDPGGLSDSTSIFVTAPFLNEIETCNANSNIFIYPNPAYDNLRLTISDRTIIADKIELIDMFGRFVKQINVDEIDNSGELIINIGELPSAVYVLKLGTSKGIYLRRFIKQ